MQSKDGLLKSNLSSPDSLTLAVDSGSKGRGTCLVSSHESCDIQVHMARKTTQKVRESKTGSLAEITSYIRAQDPKLAPICRKLTKAIQAEIPKAPSRLYHGTPVWFVGENAILGFRVTASDEIQLLFWNGQSFGEPQLKPVGKFRAAEFRFRDFSKLSPSDLRRWIRKAEVDIWDLAKLRRECS